MTLSGGCQCGAVRFRTEALGRACVCHCRMCQKATGGPFGVFVDALGLEWTRGAPAYFQSSNRARRGFCAACGTPLSFEMDGAPPNLAVGVFDDPRAVVPAAQLENPAKLPFTETLAELHGVNKAWEGVVSFQHPDHDTKDWPPQPPLA